MVLELDFEGWIGVYQKRTPKKNIQGRGNCLCKRWYGSICQSWNVQVEHLGGWSSHISRVKSGQMWWAGVNILVYQAKEFGLNSVGSREPLKDLQNESVLIWFASSFQWLWGRTAWRGVQAWNQGMCQVVFQVLLLPPLLLLLLNRVEWNDVCFWETGVYPDFPAVPWVCQEGAWREDT